MSYVNHLAAGPGEKRCPFLVIFLQNGRAMILPPSLSSRCRCVSLAEGKQNGIMEDSVRPRILTSF